MSTIHTQRLSDLAPKRGDELTDEHGTIRCMGVIDGYVMHRRSGCMPMVMSVKDWAKKVINTVQLPAADVLASSKTLVIDEANSVLGRTAKP